MCCVCQDEIGTPTSPDVVRLPCCHQLMHRRCLHNIERRRFPATIPCPLCRTSLECSLSESEKSQLKERLESRTRMIESLIRGALEYFSRHPVDFDVAHVRSDSGIEIVFSMRRIPSSDNE